MKWSSASRPKKVQVTMEMPWSFVPKCHNFSMLTVKQYNSDTLGVPFLNAPYFRYAFPPTAQPKSSLVGDFLVRVWLAMYSFFKTEHRLAENYVHKSDAEHSMKYVESQIWVVGIRETPDELSDFRRLIEFFRWLISASAFSDYKHELIKYCVFGLSLLKGKDIDPQLKSLAYELEEMLNPRPPVLHVANEVEDRKRKSMLKLFDTSEALTRKSKRKSTFSAYIPKVPLNQIIQESYGQFKEDSESIVAKLRAQGQRSNSIMSSIYKDSIRFNSLVAPSTPSNIKVPTFDIPLPSRRNSRVLENLDSLKILASGKWQEEPARGKALRRVPDKSKTLAPVPFVKFKDILEESENEEAYSQQFSSPSRSSDYFNEEDAESGFDSDEARMTELRTALELIDDGIELRRTPVPLKKPQQFVPKLAYGKAKLK